MILWRRERDSNPRDPFGAYAISSRAPSTTRPSLQRHCRGRLEPLQADLLVHPSAAKVHEPSLRNALSFSRKPFQLRINEFLDISVEDFLGAGGFAVRAQVLHHLVRMQDVT